MSARASDERGASLIMALVFVTIFTAIAVAILDQASTGLIATERYRELRTSVYAADGGVDAAIEVVRADPLLGAVGGTCPPFTTVVGESVSVTCSNVNASFLDLDRKVEFTGSVGGVARVKAVVIYRDNNALTPSTPAVDILSWRYLR